MSALEQALMHDPLLASNLLRYANSPLHRRTSDVTNVPVALKLLGLKSVRSAIVTATIRSILPSDNAIGQAALAHMVDISMLCKLVGSVCCPGRSDDQEFLGLVHDVGMLTLAANYESVYDALMTRSHAEHIAIDALEREEFGISHDIVTARTAQEFRLPGGHIDILMTFHSREPVQAIESDEIRDTCVLALAHRLRNEFADTGQHLEETIIEDTDQLVGLLGISSGQLDDIRARIPDILEANIRVD